MVEPPRVGLRVEPNPVQEGQEVTITYTGSGTLRYTANGGDWVEVALDANGEAKLTFPAGTQGVFFSDGVWPEGHSEFLDVVTTQG